MVKNLIGLFLPQILAYKVFYHVVFRFSTSHFITIIILYFFSSEERRYIKRIVNEKSKKYHLNYHQARFPLHLTKNSSD